MNSKIEHLLRKYLTGEETNEDFQALMEFINSGAADEIIQHRFSEELEELIKAGAEADDREKQHLQKVFARIRPKLQTPYAPPTPVKTRPLSPVRYRSGRTDNGSFLKRIAAVAALIVISLTGSWFYAVTQQTLPVSNEQMSNFYSGAQQITLPDESVVLLNEGSSLTHKTDFGKNNREVWLDGEGFFDIRNNPSRPFKVITGEIISTVLGTSFNVKGDDKEVTVTVTHGVVEVGDEVQVYGQIVANEQLAVNKITREFEKSSNLNTSVLEWKNRFIFLDNIALAEAAKMIGERFNVRITITNEELRQAKISATFLREEGLEHIIQSICLITRASYTISEDHIEITGGLDMK